MAAASRDLNDEANGLRLSKLLINKGTQALRTTLLSKIPNLNAELNKEHTKLHLESKKFITKDQWKLLYPSSGSPADVRNFDITLLTILLRNICGLSSPTGGWDKPSDSDTSISANIARMKFYRNKVYGHITTIGIDDGKFEKYWMKISEALKKLGISAKEIDDLKKAPLTPEEENYIEALKDWYEKEVELIKISLDTKEKVTRIEEILLEFQRKKRRKRKNIESKEVRKRKVRRTGEIDKELPNKSVPDLEMLGKCPFDSFRKELVKKYLPDTREWLFNKVSDWFDNDTEDASNVMILIAGPGVGKSVFSAELCQRFTDKGKLAACHFCKYNRSDYGDPRILIESLASTMCDTIPGFESELKEVLRRHHREESLSDAFRVFLHDPLHGLKKREPMLLVIDALDESQVEGKSDLLDLIREEFRRLPHWIKIFITSRPELPVQNELRDLKPVEITKEPNDSNNTNDLRIYLKRRLHAIDDEEVLESLVGQCEGSFLYAFHAQEELNEKKIALTPANIQQLVPLGLHRFYERQFKHVKEQLNLICSSLNKAALSDENFQVFLEVLATFREFLPLRFIPQCLGFHEDIKFLTQSKINDIASKILPAYGDSLTVYHKSLVDWLKSDGYDKHAFTVDSKKGHDFLWRVCKRVFDKIKEDLPCISQNTKFTTMMKYALMHGIYHMVECIEDIDCREYRWAVDVVIIRASSLVRSHWAIKSLWRSFWLRIIAMKGRSLNEKLSQQLLWHIRMSYGVSLASTYYLQLLANRIDNSKEEDDQRLTARDQLEKGKFLWFEDLDSTYLTSCQTEPLPLSSNVTSLDVSSNQQLLAVGRQDGNISILKLPNFQELHLLTDETNSNVAMCSTEEIKRFPIYDQFDTYGSESIKFGYNCGDVCCCSFSSSGDKLVTCDGSNKVKLWDVNKGCLLSCLQADDCVNFCYFTDSGSYIIAYQRRCYSMAPTLTSWDALTYQRINLNNLQHQEFLLRRNHWRGCISEHTNQSTKISLDHRNLTACRCRFLEFDRSVPVTVQGSYVVPHFSELHVFEVNDRPKTPTVIDEIPEIKHGCFSPNGSFLATFANGDPVVLHIWSTRSCSIVEIKEISMKNMIGCWWSGDFLWLCDGSDHLMKAPVSAEGTVDIAQVKRLNFSIKPKEFLTIAEVLVFKDEENVVRVARIINDVIECDEICRVDDGDLCAAVSPDNSLLFIATNKTWSIWKRSHGYRESQWEHLHSDSNPFPVMSIDKVTCCGIKDGKSAVLSVSCSGLLYVYDVDFSTHKMKKIQKFSRDENMSHMLVASSSYYIAMKNERNLVVFRIESGEVVAQSRETDLFPGVSVIVYHQTGLVAYITERGRVRFFRIHNLMDNEHENKY